MAFPTFLPNALKYASRDEDKLLTALKRNPFELVAFFEYAAADETWSERHASFMQKAMTWLTVEYFLDRLDLSLVQRIATAIQKHFYMLKDDLPTDLMVKVKSETIRMNSLLLGAASRYLHERLRTECMEKNLSTLELRSFPKKVFALFREYINTGKIENLWRLEDKELMQLLHYATALEIRQLAYDIAEVLKRYFTKNNVLNFLIKGFDSRLNELNNACVVYINQLPAGARIPKIAENGLTFEFLDFSDQTLEIFYSLTPYIKGIMCQGSLIESPVFGDLLQRCPKLSELDISNTPTFPETLKLIPLTLEHLNVSKCEWLTDDKFKEIMGHFSGMSHLAISGNTQLTYRSFGDLQKLRNLNHLDISRCIQIDDEDFKLILKACQDLNTLLLDQCKKLTESGFIELSKKSQRLVKLSLSRTQITEHALAELLSRCFLLEFLDLTRCQNISEKSLFELIKMARSLKEINITGCRISEEAVVKLRSQYPYLAFIVED